MNHLLRTWVMRASMSSVKHAYPLRVQLHLRLHKWKIGTVLCYIVYVMCSLEIHFFTEI